MDIFAVNNLFSELDDDEVLRMELINGTKLYCLPRDKLIIDPNQGSVGISKLIKNDKKQQIRINPEAIVLVCTMSRQTYGKKLKRGELYV